MTQAIERVFEYMPKFLDRNNETQTVCMECGETIDLRALCSVAGYYIGFCCPNCGPYSRESGYFHSRNEAETASDLGDFGRL